MTNTAKTTTAYDAAVAAMREAGYKMDSEESYEDLAAQFGWDAIERGESDEGRFVSEADYEAPSDQDRADLQWVLDYEAFQGFHA